MSENALAWFKKLMNGRVNWDSRARVRHVARALKDQVFCQILIEEGPDCAFFGFEGRINISRCRFRLRGAIEREMRENRRELGAESLAFPV